MRKKYLPLNSFAKHGGWEGRGKWLWPHQKKYKLKKKVLCYTLQGWAPVIWAEIQAASTYGNSQKGHSLLRGNEHSPDRVELTTEGSLSLSPCSHKTGLCNLVFVGFFVCLGVLGSFLNFFFLSQPKSLPNPSASTELRQTQMSSNCLIIRKVRPCSPLPQKTSLSRHLSGFSPAILPHFIWK